MFVYVKYDALWEALTDLCMQSYSSPDKCRNNCKYKGNPFFLPIGLPSWISWLELVQSLFHFPDKMKSFTREITCTLPNCDVNNHKYLLTLNTCTFRYDTEFRRDCEGRQCKVCRLDQASCYYKERAGDPPPITISSYNKLPKGGYGRTQHGGSSDNFWH